MGDDKASLIIEMHGNDTMTSRCSACSKQIDSWFKMKCPGCGRLIEDALLKMEAIEEKLQPLGRPDGLDMVED